MISRFFIMLPLAIGLGGCPSNRPVLTAAHTELPPASIVFPPLKPLEAHIGKTEGAALYDERVDHKETRATYEQAKGNYQHIVSELGKK